VGNRFSEENGQTGGGGGGWGSDLKTAHFVRRKSSQSAGSFAKNDTPLQSADCGTLALFLTLRIADGKPSMEGVISIEPRLIRRQRAAFAAKTSVGQRRHLRP